MPSFKPLKHSRKKRKLFNWIGVLGLTLATFSIAYYSSTKLRFIQIEPEGPRVLLQKKQSLNNDVENFFWVRPPWSQNWQELRHLPSVKFSSENDYVLAHLPLANKGFRLIKGEDSLGVKKDSLISLPKGAAAYRVFKALKDSLQSNWTQMEIIPDFDLKLDPSNKISADASASNCALNSDGDTLCIVSDRPLWVKLLTLP